VRFPIGKNYCGDDVYFLRLLPPALRTPTQMTITMILVLYLGHRNYRSYHSPSPVRDYSKFSDELGTQDPSGYAEKMGWGLSRRNEVVFLLGLTTFWEEKVGTFGTLGCADYCV